jgi:nucleoside-diphosphate-sugar epimerase
VVLSGLPVDVVQGSHEDRAALDRALVGIEVVYHLAKATGQRWDDYVKGDVEPTRVLAEAALAHKVARFIYTGTIDSYDSADARTVIDSSSAVDARIARRNLYARSKAACEAILQRMHAERGLPLVIFRPGVVIGAGSPPAHWGVGMFHSDTRAQLWGSGTTKLPLVLVDDVAEGLALGMEVPGIEGRTFLLTDAPLLTAREYVEEVEAASATRISAPATPIWRFFVLDAAKEAVKHLIRHPNRRVPSYHDWSCRAHRARYDNGETRRALGWQPAATREALVEHGVVAAVRHYFG